MKVGSLVIQRLDSSKEDIEEMVKNEGIWLCVDIREPEALVPIISIGCKLYAIIPAQELSPDGFRPTARFCGPFTPADVTEEAK